MIRIAVTLFMAAVPLAFGQAAGAEARAGEEHEITKSYETSEKRSDGGSGSSRGSDTLLERVVEVRADGVELEYDLPKDATAEDRARDWKFPARVLRTPSGELQLLNRPALEARLEAWLKAAKWTREICGRWIFTWDAFRIDCDPEKVLKIIDAYDLTSVTLHEGAPYQSAGALEPGKLNRRAESNGATFAATVPIDPEFVRRGLAEADVALGEIMQEPVTLEAALAKRAKESVSGTISTTFETDAAGKVLRRTTVTKIQRISADGVTETKTATDTLERRRLAVPSQK